MKVIFELGRFCLMVLAVAGMFYAARYSMSQGIQTVIASQPAPEKLVMESPRFDRFRDCELIPLYGTKSSKPPCKFDPAPPPPPPKPIQTMSKADSERAGLWFLLSALALPLALGGVVAIAYVIRN